MLKFYREIMPCRRIICFNQIKRAKLEQALFVSALGLHYLYNIKKTKAQK